MGGLYKFGYGIANSEYKTKSMYLMYGLGQTERQLNAICNVTLKGRRRKKLINPKFSKPFMMYRNRKWIDSIYSMQDLDFSDHDNSCVV